MHGPEELYSANANQLSKLICADSAVDQIRLEYVTPKA